MQQAAKTRRKTPKQDENIRQRIIDASIEYMTAYGSDKLSMVDVARAAKVARATVYNYFDSKEALIEAAEYSLEDLLWKNLSLEVEKFDGIEEKLAAMAIFLCAIWTDRKHTPWYGFLSPTDEAMLLSSRASDHIRQLADFIEPILVKAKKMGQVRSSLEIDAASTWVARIVFTFALERQMKEPLEIMSLFKGFLLKGFGPPR